MGPARPNTAEQDIMDEWTKAMRTRLLNKKAIYESPAFQASRSPEAIALKTNFALPYIDAALRRIDDGTYEECVDCGEDIARERHETTPGAIRCASCQADLETLRDATGRSAEPW